MSKKLERFFTDFLQKAIIEKDKEVGRLENLKDQTFLHDPRDERMCEELFRSGILSEIPQLPIIEEKIRFEQSEILNKTRLLKIWPIFIKAVAKWNPEVDLEPRIEAMDVSAVKFLDQVNSEDPDVIICLAGELLDLGDEILDGLNQITKQEIMEKMQVIQKAFTIIQNTEALDAISKKELQDRYTNLSRYYTRKMRNFDDKGGVL